MRYLRHSSLLLSLVLLTLGCAACRPSGGNATRTETGETPTSVPVTGTDTGTGAGAETLTGTDTPTVRLTFSPGVAGMEDVTVNAAVTDTAVTLPGDPVRAGYAFKGWYTGENGAGERITCASPLTGDATYYACWAPYTDMSSRNCIRIGGFNGITESDAVEADFKALADCGIDQIYFTFFHDNSEDGVYTLEKSVQYLRWLEKYGIQSWINDWKLNELLKNRAPAEECMALLNVYKDSPAYCGNYLADEPTGDTFDSLQSAVTYFRELMPGREMYVNLFPNIAPPTAFINGSYEAYIRAFLTDFPLSYVSQDFYPIDIDARGRKNVSEQYYASLSVMCRAARDAGKEAWMYIYTMRDTVNAVKDYEPTLADVRFEANTALAFGCNSITYYCFDCPPSYAKSDSFGMLKNHERTSLFEVGAQVTREIKALSEVFPRYLWRDAGMIARSPRIKRMLRNAGIQSVADMGLPCTVTSVSDVLVGWFEEANGDGMALMLVNHNDLNTGNAAEVILTFSGAQSVTARIGTETTVLTPAADGTYALTLSAGQGCFLEVTF